MCYCICTCHVVVRMSQEPRILYSRSHLQVFNIWPSLCNRCCVPWSNDITALVLCTNITHCFGSGLVHQCWLDHLQCNKMGTICKAEHGDSLTHQLMQSCCQLICKCRSTGIIIKYKVDYLSWHFAWDPLLSHMQQLLYGHVHMGWRSHFGPILRHVRMCWLQVPGFPVLSSSTVKSQPCAAWPNMHIIDEQCTQECILYQALNVHCTKLCWSVQPWYCYVPYLSSTLVMIYSLSE